MAASKNKTKTSNKLLLTRESEIEKLNQPQKSFLHDLLKLVCISLLQLLHYARLLLASLLPLVAAGFITPLTSVRHCE